MWDSGLSGAQSLGPQSYENPVGPCEYFPKGPMETKKLDDL